MKKRKYLMWAVILLIAAGLFCIAYGQNNKVVLEVGIFSDSNWDVPNANVYTIMDKTVEKFEKEHPGVKVQYESGIRKKDYSEWLSRKAMKGELPDVFFVTSEDFYTYSTMGILKKLDAKVSSDKDFRENYFFKTGMEAGQYHNTQYALPYEIVPKLMFVNRTLLEKEGFSVPETDWTWDDMEKICREVTKDTDGDGVIDQFGTFNYGWKEAAYSNGAEMFDVDGKQAYFSDKKMIDAVKFTKTLDNLNQKRKVTQKDFETGRVAFMPLSFSEYRMYKTYPYKIKKYSGFQWDCTTMPAGPQGDNISEVNTLLVGMNEHTKHEELAWEFMKTLTYDLEIQRDIFHYSQGASSLKYVTGSKYAESIIRRDMDADEKVIDCKLLESVIENGKTVRKFSGYDSAMLFAESRIEEMYENDKNIESSIKILQRDILNFVK